MRQLHHIIAFVRFSFTATILFLIFKSDGNTEKYFGILIVCDAITLGFEALRVKQLKEAHEIVSIQYPKSMWARLSPYVWVVASAFYAYHAYESQSIELTTIVPIYIAGTYFLFKKNRADFYIDTKGMVQPELFKKNYVWPEISNFEIYDDAISFSLKNKPAEISIPEGKAKEVHEFMIKHRLEEFVTIP